MSCPSLLEPKNCLQTGMASVVNTVPVGGTSLELESGGGVRFPAPSSGRVYYAIVYGCGCCNIVKVTNLVGDTLTIEPVNSPIVAGSFIEYSTALVENIELIARSVMPTFMPPLQYDCVTNTVTIDCAALKDLATNPCP